MGIHFWVCEKASKIWQSSGRGVGGDLTKLERPFGVSYSAAAALFATLILSSGCKCFVLSSQSSCIFKKVID